MSKDNKSNSRNGTSKLNGRKTLKVNSFLNEFEKDEIKKQVNIVKLFSYFNVSLTKKGKNYVGLCPWHDDRNPSLSVDPEKGLYNCFGCGESGDIFTLVEKMKGFDFKEALKFLKEYIGSSSSTVFQGMKPGVDIEVKNKNNNGKLLNENEATQPKNEKGTGENAENNKIERKATSEPIPNQTWKRAQAKENSSISEEQKENGISKENGSIPNQTWNRAQAKTDNEGKGEPETISLNTITDYYHKKLIQNQTAIKYLEERGIKSKEIIIRFKIGFCFSDGSLKEKISESQLKALIKKGVFNENGKEHFLGCLVFPVIDDLENTVGFYGRKISNSSNPLHLYLKGNHKGVFNSKALKVFDSIILTESIIDCISLIEMGLENVQACFGVNGFTDFHLKILKDNLVKEIIIAFDNDEPGKKASIDLKEKLLKEDFKVKVIFPEGKDWNEDLINNVSADDVKQKIEITESFQSPFNQVNDFKAKKEDGNFIFTTAEIIYRVSGVKEIFINNLRVNIKAEHAKNSDEKYYDNLDLYSARSRSSYSSSLARNFELEPKQVEKDLIKILEYLEERRDRNLNPLDADKKEELTEEEKDLGFSLLKSPDLFDQVVSDMEVLGYVGEDLNKQLLYIAGSSRLMDDPISVLIVSQSASGKSYLVDTIKKLLPPEDVIEATSLSDQALNYMGDLEHKFIDLSEAVHNDIIEHQLREMLSAKQLSRIVASKDPKTGETTTKSIKTKAIVSTVMSSTNHNVNPENASRCFVIDTDESREQTKLIHEAQRQKHTFERIEQKKISFLEL